MELTDQQTQEKVAQIEKLKIGAYQAAELIWILLGLKPATWLELYENNNTEDELIACLISINLAYQKVAPIGSSFATIVVAKDAEVATKFALASTEEEFGRLLGFPETAVSAFVTRDFLSDEEELRLDNSFVRYRLSKTHWKEELKHKKYLEHMLELYSPKLFQKLSQFRRQITD